MEGNKRGDYPTGSSGGGGKKGYSLKHQLETDAPSMGEDSNEQKNTKKKNAKVNVAIDSILKLADDQEGHASNSRHVPVRGNSSNAAAYNFDQEPRYQHYNDDNRYRIEEVDLGIDRDGYVDYDQIFGSNNRNQNEGQRRPDIGHDLPNPYRVNEGCHVGRQDYALQGLGYIWVQGVGWQQQRQEHQPQISANYNKLHLYITKTCQAYRSRSTDLTNLMSIRDSHVLDIFNVHNHDMLGCRACDVPELIEPLMNHVQCIRALMERRLLDALAYQRAVTVIMSNLVRRHCFRGELWATHMTFMIFYELKLLWEKAKDLYQGPRYFFVPAPQPPVEVNWVAEYIYYFYFEGRRYRMVGEYRSRSFFNQ